MNSYICNVFRVKIHSELIAKQINGNWIAQKLLFSMGNVMQCVKYKLC